MAAHSSILAWSIYLNREGRRITEKSTYAGYKQKAWAKASHDLHRWARNSNFDVVIPGLQTYHVPTTKHRTVF